MSATKALPRPVSPARPAGSSSDASSTMWKLDTYAEAPTETSVLGSHFAQAVALIASGAIDDLMAQTEASSKVSSAFASKAPRRIFSEDPMYNPPLLQASLSYGYHAYMVEQKKYWRKAGTVFPRAQRKCRLPTDHVVYESVPEGERSSVKVFGRRREVLPMLRRKKLLQKDTSELEKVSVWKTMDNCSSRPAVAQVLAERAVENLRVNPLTYKLPDLWESKRHGGSVQESSQFKSTSSRFASEASQLSLHQDQEPRRRAPKQRSKLAAPGAPTRPLPAPLASPKSELEQSSWDSILFDAVGDEAVFLGRQLENDGSPWPSELQIQSLTSSQTQRQSPVPMVSMEDIPSPVHMKTAPSIPINVQCTLQLAPALATIPKQRSFSADAAKKSPTRIKVSSPPPLPSLRVTPSLSIAQRSQLAAAMSGSGEPGTAPRSAPSSDQMPPPHATPSYSKALIARWNPPLCYSRKSALEVLLSVEKSGKGARLPIDPDYPVLDTSVDTSNYIIHRHPKPLSGNSLHAKQRPKKHAIPRPSSSSK